MSLDTTLTFLKWQKLYEIEKPFQIFINIPDDAKDRRSTNLEWETHPVTVNDARGHEEEFTLDDHGFIFRKHAFQTDSFVDRDFVEKNYFPEVEQFLRKEVDGVDRVFFFDWRLRRVENKRSQDIIDLNDPTDYLNPAKHVHVDQSTIAVINRVLLQLPEEAERLLRGRIRVLNIWRPLKHKIQDWPLALCDGSTVDPSDLIESDHIRRHYQGSTLYLLPRPVQKWYYLSGQTPNEVTIFKNFDSEQAIKAKYAPHAACEQIPVAKGVSLRESVEVRALVFTYKKDA